jgi:hypothetical protein
MLRRILGISRHFRQQQLYRVRPRVFVEHLPNRDDERPFLACAWRCSRYRSPDSSGAACSCSRQHSCSRAFTCRSSRRCSPPRCAKPHTDRCILSCFFAPHRRVRTAKRSGAPVLVAHRAASLRAVFLGRHPFRPLVCSTVFTLSSIARPPQREPSTATALWRPVRSMSKCTRRAMSAGTRVR